MDLLTGPSPSSRPLLIVYKISELNLKPILVGRLLCYAGKATEPHTYLLSCSDDELAEPEVEVICLVGALTDQLPVVGLVVAGLALAQVQPGGGGGGREAAQHQGQHGEQPAGHHCEVRRGEVCRTGALEHWSQEPHSCTNSLRCCWLASTLPLPPLHLSSVETPDITSTLLDWGLGWAVLS